MSTKRNNEGGNGDGKTCDCPDVMASPKSSLCGTCRGIKTAAMYYQIHNQKKKERADSEAQYSSESSRSYLDSIVQCHTQSGPQPFQQKYAGAGTPRYSSSTSYPQTPSSTGYQYFGTTGGYSNNPNQSPAAYGGNNQYHTSTDSGNAQYFSNYNTPGSGSGNSSGGQRGGSKNVHFQEDVQGQN